jgi:hypothetical protein
MIKFLIQKYNTDKDDDDEDNELQVMCCVIVCSLYPLTKVFTIAVTGFG